MFFMRTATGPLVCITYFTLSVVHIFPNSFAIKKVGWSSHIDLSWLDIEFERFKNFSSVIWTLMIRERILSLCQHREN